MNESNPSTDSTLPPIQSMAGLTPEQTDALAKVYRFLLTLQDEKTAQDVGENHAPLEGIVLEEKFLKPAAEPPDE